MAKKIRLIIFGVLLLAVIIMTGTTVYFARKASKAVATVEVKSDSTTASSTPQEAGDIILAVSKLILLPSDEEPTIATVSDPSKLKDQPFFANAKTGDKVLIYQKAKKAYLYSVTENRLIEVAPISVGESTPPATTSTQSAPAPKK